MSILNKIGNLLTRDLTGQTWTEEHEHSYFQNLIYSGTKKPGQSYWEASIPFQGCKDGRIGVTMTGGRDGPTDEEIVFCKMVISDTNKLFERCREAFEPVYKEWLKRPMPVDWHKEFELDGFEVPIAGDPANKWEACYYVESVGHYFIAIFNNGKVSNVEVDG